MSGTPTGANRADHEAAAEIASCALDPAGIEDQRARYAALSRSVTHLERTHDSVLVDFDRDLDREKLHEALSVERDCCPFLELSFDAQSRRLRATVTAPDQLPALEAVAYGLEPVASSRLASEMSPREESSSRPRRRGWRAIVSPRPARKGRPEGMDTGANG
jgi:hypothetical protein